MEFLIASCFIFPLSALWIQSREDDNNEDEMDFLLFKPVMTVRLKPSTHELKDPWPIW